jgi:hypothetical protein
LDPGETGSHGVSLIEFSEGKERHRHLPLAGIRYENIDVDLGEPTASTPFDPILHRTLKSWIESNRRDLQYVERLVLRITFRGNVPSIREVEQYGSELSERAELELEGITFNIDKVRNQCEPQISLDELSQSQSPPGLLAQKILLLKTKEPAQDYRLLLDEGVKKVRSHLDQSNGATFTHDSWQDEEAMRELLLESCFLLLDSFLQQKMESQ